MEGGAGVTEQGSLPCVREAAAGDARVSWPTDGTLGVKAGAWSSEGAPGSAPSLSTDLPTAVGGCPLAWGRDRRPRLIQALSFEVCVSGPEIPAVMPFVRLVSNACRQVNSRPARPWQLQLL